jgi:hypothetical protein
MIELTPVQLGEAFAAGFVPAALAVLSAVPIRLLMRLFF